MISLVLIVVGSCLVISSIIVYLAWRDNLFSSTAGYIIVFLELIALTSLFSVALFGSVFLLGRIVQ